MDEGLADYERGQWTPLDLMTVRDAAVADIVPKMSETRRLRRRNNPRLDAYNLGHAVFEFIEAKWGKEGIRQFMFSLRKSVIGGGEDAYEEAFKMKKDEFDQAFDRYLKDRFKPFRDKERPADYGRDLAPNPREDGVRRRLLDRAVAVGRSHRRGHRQHASDHEFDIVLLSAKDGSIVRNLTRGFDKDLRLRSHRLHAGRAGRDLPWMSWSPKGDRLAYFVRTEKERTLIVQNVLTRKIEVRVPMKSVDEPESPAFAPDGRTVAFSALRGGDRRHLHRRPRDRRQVVNLTNDDFADYGADLRARRQDHHLQRARQRQPQAVPARPRHEVRRS